MEGYDVGEQQGCGPRARTLPDTSPTVPVAPPAAQPTLPGAGWRVAVGAIWLLAVFLTYYTVHKPFTPSDLVALRMPPVGASWQLARVAGRVGGELLDVLAAAWMIVLAGAIGQALWRSTRLPRAGSAESRLLGTVLGLGAIGLAAFGLAELALLRAPVAYALLAAPTLVLVRGCLAQALWWGHVARAWWRAGWTAGGRIERVAVLFVVASSALVALDALLPPIAWDALAYHLPVVRADALAGRIVLDPNNPQGYQPQLVELLYTLLYLVRGGDGAVQPLHAASGALAVALVAWMAWRAAGPRAGVRATALALAIPLVTTAAGWAYVDLPLTAAELAAVLALALWQAEWRVGDTRAARGWLVVAGVCAGVGLDIKYTGVYAIAALALLILLVAWRRSGLAGNPADDAPAGQPRSAGWWWRVRTAARPAIAFGALAVAVGCVWLVRNALLIGDPIFPYHLGALLPQGPHWDAGRTAYMESGGWGLAALWRAPLLPLETTLLGSQLSVEFDGTIGPLLLLLLALAPLTLAARPAWLAWTRGKRGEKPPRQVKVAHTEVGASDMGLPVAAADGTHALFWRWPLGYALVLGLFWSIELARSVVAMQSRLWLSLFVALVVPAAVAWPQLERVRVPAVSLGRLLAAGVVLCLGLTLATQAVQTLTADNLAELLGAQDRQAYLTQQLGDYARAMTQVDTLGPAAHVLFLWEPRTYLSNLNEAQLTPDAFIDNANTLYRHCGTGADITRCLRTQGYTHVLLYREGMWFVRSQPSAKDPPGQWAALDAARATWTVVYHDDSPLAVPGASASDTTTGPGWYVLYALPTG